MVENGDVSNPHPRDRYFFPFIYLFIYFPFASAASQGFLPTFPENDLQEKTRTLEMFFMDENFRHGTPLRLFHEQLCKGFFNPEIAKVRTIHKKMLLREYR